MHIRATLLLTAFLNGASPTLVSAQAPSDAEMTAAVETYADIAEAAYSDSLATAKTLDLAIRRLVAEPSDANLAAARDAWRMARIPYMQTEVYRFANPLVDDWEGKVNAWPLDEGLIDYVAPLYGDSHPENQLYTLNVIANPIVLINGVEVDASVISPALLTEELHEAEGIEANVATGYHAIEFLLWGQDLNGTGPGAGSRPASDFDPANCTGGNCARRIAYLTAASELLIDDLEDMAAAWGEEGLAREALRLVQPAFGVSRILTGMGSLSYGELAGERMKLGLLLHDPEEEHDCFSDLTHISHYYDALGIQNVYLGRYERIDGRRLEGPSLSALVAAVDPALDAEMRRKLAATMNAAAALKERAETVEAYDQMLALGNTEGNTTVEAMIAALIDQTRTIERIGQALNASQLDILGSDSLDDQDAVFE